MKRVKYRLGEGNGNDKNKGSKPETKKMVVKMSVNGSGIRDISRVLGISQNTVIAVLKKQKKSLQILTLNM